MKKTESNRASILKDLAILFLKLGTTAFGGPAAHVAMMQDEVVVRRKWLTQQEFLDSLSATNFIPGPNSTELAIHIGHKMAGWRGLLIAGGCFILPAVLIVSVLGWVYVSYGSLPAVQSVMYGIKPVIIAIVAQAIWNLSKSAVKTKFLAALALAAVCMNALGVDELLTIFAIGLISLVGHIRTKRNFTWALAPFRIDSRETGVLSSLALSSIVPVAFANSKLFLFFLKVGSVLFGSGYVLLAFLKGDLVDKWHWLTDQQLLDSIAVGQFTPGPVFTTATFIGYVLSGPTGAALSTLGIFLPAFAFVALSAPFLPKLRSSAAASATLDGINVGSLAVMTVTALLLAKSSVYDIETLLIAIVSGAILIRFRINSAWLVLAGGFIGYLPPGSS
jgi:chromate transporter